MNKTITVQLFAVLAGVAWVSGCGGGDATVTITSGSSQTMQVHGTVNMPNGQLTAAPGSPLQRFAAVLLPEAEALSGTSHVGSGVVVSLILAHSDGSEDPPVAISPPPTTNAQGQFSIQLPAQTNPDTCRYLLAVGDGASLTRAFVTSTSSPDDIDAASEAAVRLVFGQVAQGLSLCHYTSSDLDTLVTETRALPVDVSGLTTAQANDKTYAAAVIEIPLTPVPDTPTPRPTITPIGPTATATIPSTPIDTPTALPSSTRTNTFAPSQTFTPLLTFTPIPTATFTPLPGTPTLTGTSTNTPLPTITPTATGTSTDTPPPSDTPTATLTPTLTLTPTPTFTLTFTDTPTFTPTPTFTATQTPSHTPCADCPTDTPTSTNTPTLPPTDTATPTNTATLTNTAAATVTPTITPTSAVTPTFAPLACQLNGTGNKTQAFLSSALVALGLPLNGNQTWRVGPVDPVTSTREVLVFPTESLFDCVPAVALGQSIKICARLDPTTYCQGGPNNGQACPPADCGGSPCDATPAHGVIDCAAGGGNITGYDSFVQIDHDTNKAVVGGKPNSGLPQDPNCVATFTAPDGSVSQSCLEPATPTTPGPGTPTPTPLAPGAETCPGDMHIHPNVCNSPTLQTFSNTSPVGGIKLHEAIDIDFVLGSDCTVKNCACDTQSNTSGNVCTSDADCGNGKCLVCPPENCPLQNGELLLAGDISSGLSKGVIWQANNTALIFGTTGAGNGAAACNATGADKTCITEIHGAPVPVSGNCLGSAPTSLSGTTLSLAYPAIDFPTIGDLIATLTLQCQ